MEEWYNPACTLTVAGTTSATSYRNLEFANIIVSSGGLMEAMLINSCVPVESIAHRRILARAL